MAEITAAKVKELREKSGAGMMDCKKALEENNGDMDAAVDWLRTKGLASAAKKAGRAATEGLVAAVTKGNQGALVEVNAETDFVARNEQFQSFVGRVAEKALDTDGSLDALAAADLDGKSVADTLTDLIATIGENMSLRRVVKLEVAEGVVTSYIHNALQPGMGKIGVLVGLQSSGDAAKLEQLGRQIAMHVAAARPQSATVEDLDPEILARERAVLIEQAKEAGKPEDIAQKMVEGRIRKYYEDVVLLEQVYVIDGESKVKDVIARAAGELGAEISGVTFARFELGEGLEKKEEDFAEEVAKMAG